MNTKKKHKNKPKPNPHPPQKVDNKATVEKVEENVEEIPEAPTKSEERVPEIVSEVLAPPVPEPKVAEADTPKKPKRNRGKNKKGGKEDDDDDKPEQTVTESAVEDVKTIEEATAIKSMEIPTAKPTEVTDVTPTARKKKNKNKKNIEHIDEPPKTAETEDLPITEAVKSEVENVVSDVKQEIIPTTPDITEQNIRNPKKKNKKKNRTDSDRSDKAEETTACTAVFQKLLEGNDETKDNKTIKDIKVDDILPLEDIKPITIDDAKASESIEKEVKIETSIATSETKDNKTEITPITELTPVDTSKEDSGKNKKKNKKDKKHLSKPEEPQPELSETAVTIDTFTEAQPVIAPAATEIVTEATKEKEDKEPEVLITKIEKEKSPKPKAKIAKPVEKKRKGKDETDGIEPENVSGTEEKIISDISLTTATPTPQPAEVKEIQLAEETKPTQEATKAIEIKPVEIITKVQDKTIPEKEEHPQPAETLPKALEKPVPEKEELKISAEIITKEIEETMQGKEEIAKLIPQIESIRVPENGMGKKRRKSPKPPKRTETPTGENKHHIGIDPNVSVQPAESKNVSIKTSEKEMTAAVTEAIPLKDSSECIIEVKTEILPVVDPVQSITEQTTESLKDEDIPMPLFFDMPLREPEIKPTIAKESSSSEPKVEEHKVEHIAVPETGMGKKRKKSPKMPRKFDIKTESKATVTDSTKTDEDIKEEREKRDSPADLPPLEDIEIRSIKTDESEGLACDTVPDVQYPRSSSQLDNNNNIIIREMPPPAAKDAKLNIPTVIPDTPFIKGSGDTPITTPEFVPTGIRITEIDAKISKPTQEKTDLKSKVMEVNKDMEDLRLSIERSLAELTAMEKSEKESEKKIETKAEKAEDKKTDIKQETESKTKDMKQTDLQDSSSKSKDETKISSKEVETTIELPPFQGINKPLPEEQTPVDKSIPLDAPSPPPVHPPRKDNKGKGKSKKKGKHDSEHGAIATAVGEASTTPSSATGSSGETKTTSQETKKEEKSEQKAESTQEKGKQQSSTVEGDDNAKTDPSRTDFDPIDNFEDAMTSSVGADDVNKSFEMIANEANDNIEPQTDEIVSQNNPEISITAPIDDEGKADRQDKINPVSQPKNLLGHPDIPARLNKTDYKKEKNKTPNARQAKVKIKDDVPVEVNKESKESQTENKHRFLKDRKSINETITCMSNENEEYVYKYSFRKVFLPSACHVCKKELKQLRVPCNFCNLVFYCSPKHKDEDYQQHQALCFAVSTIVRLKDQRYMYADTKDVTGHNYRLLRMQMIVSCEKVLKRKLVPWEQEALLYPRICADASCREWRQGKLKDCEGCGQISYCTDHPEHLPTSHQRWCKSYSLYQKLVCYQQTKGRLEPKLPSRVMAELYQIPEKINEVLASMYEEKIDMTDIQYAALTQLATAPLTATFCQQLHSNKMNSTYANGVHKKSSFSIHVVGAELQFEADALNKWETFFLHLRPDVKDLRIVLVGPELNPSQLPLDLLAKIKLCENCRQKKRRLIFDFQDKKTYQEYWSTDFTTPDLVCAFNPSIQRSATFNGKDTWPSTIKCILKLKVPFIITAYTLNELQRDLARIKECAETDFNVVSEPKSNAFASVRPDRNFISDDEMPLLFKNYCFAVVCGAF